MSHSGQKFSQLLSELKQDYLVALPQKISKIRPLITDQNWVDLAEEYHKLKGTGKTYGFPEVSTLCEQLELLARKNPEPHQQLFNETLDLLEKMRQSYAQGQILDLKNEPTWLLLEKTTLALKTK